MHKHLKMSYVLALVLFAAPSFAQAPAPAAEPEEKSIAVFGQTIRYWDVGSGPVVVLVHGLGSAKDSAWAAWRCPFRRNTA